MSVRMVVSLLSGDSLRSIAQGYQRRMQIAAVKAIADVTEQAKVSGRKSIAAGGFSSKWQNALRARVYPNADVPLSPAGLVWHKIAYSAIFESGGPIAGKPTLWLPTSQVPQGRGSRPLTPKQYTERVGPLRTIKVPGRPPILAGRGSRAGIIRATPTVTRLRKRAVKSGSILGAWVPLFIGVPTVNLRQRFHVHREVKQAADQIGARYAAHFAPEG